MTIAEIMKKMVALSEGNVHDINHFIKVYTWAKTIGELEGLDAHTQYLLEATAIVHDIACPLCREKYGYASGKYQEQESEPLVRAFFDESNLPNEDIERIVYLVTHHHTYKNVEGMDYQILLEADFLVNADEGEKSTEAIFNMRNRVFKTKAGVDLMDSVYLYPNDLMKQADMIRETQPAYQAPVKKQGEYTVEDYFAWPEDERIELIDGVIYDMAAPVDVHQIISGLLHAKFLAYIQGEKGECVPVMSPIDVQLDEDEKTMVQPDVIIICDRNKFKNGRIFGAPELVVEVLSPSTRKKDMKIKLKKYINAGVKEYWIVDPKDKRVITYLDKGEDNINIAVYSFDDKIPVTLLGDDCVVDFAEISDYIGFLV